MSIESAKAFAERLKTDGELRSALRSAEDKAKLVKGAGFDFTMEEWQQVRKELIDKAAEDRELSDEEIAKVAGGGCWCWDGWCWDV